MSKLSFLFLPAILSSSLWAQIPSGTPLTVRMIDMVDSRTHEIGRIFRASIDEPLVIDGATVLPRGTEVRIKLVEVNQAGRLTGKAQLTLVLASIEKNGRSMDATSSEVAVAGKSRTKRTGAIVGGAAVLGAIVGAIAGGGAGAAIGAAGGAGAGGVYSVFTKGEAVKIASETRLTFTLSSAIQLDANTSSPDK